MKNHHNQAESFGVHVVVACVSMIGAFYGTAVSVVQAADPEPVHALPHASNVLAIAFSSSQKELFSVATKRNVTIRRWNLMTGKLVSETELESTSHGNSFLTTGITISPDGKLVATSDKKGLGVWSVKSGKRIANLKAEPKIAFGNCIFSANSRRLVAVESVGTSSRLGGSVSAFLFDLSDVHNFVQMGGQKFPNGKIFELKSIAGFAHEGALQIHSASISPNGKVIATSSQENGTAVFDIDSYDLLRTLGNDNSKKRHPQINDISSSAANQVLSVAFSPDGKLLATTDLLGLKIRRVSDGSILHNIDKPFRFGRSRSKFSPDGKMIARFATDSAVTIWDTQSGKELHTIKTSAHAIAFSSDGKRLAVGLSDQVAGVKVYELSQ